jgi:signal transduction histidine kinase
LSHNQYTDATKSRLCFYRDAPSIFARFYQSEESRGVWLGQAIVQSLVQAHAEAIVAESQPGKGTITRLTLTM